MFDFAFKSIEEAIYMNGHGIYVWIVLAIVIVCLISAFGHYKIKLRELKKDEIFRIIQCWKFSSVAYTTILCVPSGKG